MTLSEYKAAHGLKLRDLSGLLGFEVSTISGWLTGRRKIEAELLERISVATGGEVTPAELRPDLAAILQAPVPSQAAA